MAARRIARAQCVRPALGRARTRARLLPAVRVPGRVQVLDRGLGLGRVRVLGSGSTSGSSSGPSSGQAVGRRRSMSSTPAPLPSERIMNRRFSSSLFEGAPVQRPLASAQGAPSNVEGRSAPSREVGRFPSSPRASAPSYERAPRIERSAPRQQAVERAAPSQSIRMAPTRSPQMERFAPSRSDRVERSGPSPTGSSESRGQARSRNSR